MTIPKHFNTLNQLSALSVALPEHIHQPTLKQLAMRMQAALLDADNVDNHVTSGNSADRDTRLFVDSGHNRRVDGSDTSAQRTLILDRLYQTHVADASILVAITHEARPRLLLTRRAAHMSSHAGEVSCAGGKYDHGDGNNVITALREACEETALPPNKVQLLGQLPIQTSKSGMSVRPIVALIAPDLLLVPEVGEISRIFWADFEGLITQPTVDYAVEYTLSDNEAAQKATLITPSWQIEGEVVWGLTGRVLASLLELGFDRKLDWYYRLKDPAC